MSTWGLEKVYDYSADVGSYLEDDLVRNALDIWNLQFENERYELYVSRRDRTKIEAHVSIFHAPEADYVSIGGREGAISPLLKLIPTRAVVFLAAVLYKPLKDQFKSDKAIPTDLMQLARGKERLVDPDRAVRLTEKDASSYSTFGRSFNNPQATIEWTKERLRTELIFGTFLENELVSVASVVAWLPKMAVIIGVETKKGFRGRGFGSAVVSAAVREALSRSSSCSLGVRSDNIEALPLYRKLGFVKVQEEFWVDRGTGLTP